MSRRLRADVAGIYLAVVGITVGVGLVCKGLADITRGVRLPAVTR